MDALGVAGADGGPAMDPQIFEQPPELKEWFDKHPTEDTVHSLEKEEKNKFILMYYNEEKNPDELLETMIDEAEKILDQEVKKGGDKAEVPPEELIMSLLALSKGKAVDDMVEEVSKAYAERRKHIKGKEIDDKNVVHFTQLNLAKMAGAIQEIIMKQVEADVESRGFPKEKRSEERRVGKECRSRWSPYH